MKLSVKEVMMMNQPVDEQGNSALSALLTERLPILLADQLTRFSEKIASEMKHYEAMRIKLCAEHSKKDDKGNPILIKIPGGQKYDILDQKKFNEEFDELATAEFDIDKFEAIPIAKLINSPWPIGISSDNLSRLKKIIKQDEEEKPKLKAVE